jgi:hypothetical protein
MATGDSNDIAARVRALIPRRWFAWVAPLRDALLGGLSDSAAWGFALIAFARLQARIATATGIFLDLIAWDFFGARFTRRKGETDTAWRSRIQKEILRPRQTRAAISQMLVDLTSRTPVIIELFNPGDCGGYGIASMGGYGTGPLCYGSLQFNNNLFVTALRAPSQGIPNVDGYGGYLGGYGIGSAEYASLTAITGPITDAEIYARIAQTAAAGIKTWVALESALPLKPQQRAALLTTKPNSQYAAIL